MAYATARLCRGYCFILISNFSLLAEVTSERFVVTENIMGLGIWGIAVGFPQQMQLPPFGGKFLGMRRISEELMATFPLCGLT